MSQGASPLTDPRDAEDTERVYYFLRHGVDSGTVEE
jgi:hypothetical protein